MDIFPGYQTRHLPYREQMTVSLCSGNWARFDKRIPSTFYVLNQVEVPSVKNGRHFAFCFCRPLYETGLVVEG
jgi:hypothetical protein